MAGKVKRSGCCLLFFILLYGSSWAIKEDGFLVRRTLRHVNSDKPDLLLSYSSGKAGNPENVLGNLRKNKLELKTDLPKPLEIRQRKKVTYCIGNCDNNFPNGNFTVRKNYGWFTDWINSTVGAKVPEKRRHRHATRSRRTENFQTRLVNPSPATLTTTSNIIDSQGFSNESNSVEYPFIQDSSEDNELEWENNTGDFSRRSDLIEKFVLAREKEVEVWKMLGLFEESFLEGVNEHWLKFPKESRKLHLGIAGFYAVIMVVGCGGNFLVIWMFIRCRSLRTPPNYLIVNLAISDFLMISKAPIFIINSWYEGPALGEIGCQIYGFVGGLTGTCSILTLAAISFDRYYVIVHPLNPFKKTTKRRAFLMLTIVWVYAGTFSSIPLFGLNAYVSEGLLTSCSFDYLSEAGRDRAFVFAFFFAAYVMPIIAISFSYINIFIMVRAAERLEVFGRNSVGTERDRMIRESFKSRHAKEKQKNEMKIAILSGSLILVWTLAWTPYAVVALMGIFGWKEQISPLGSALPAIFCKTASCIDPFVYAINHPRFQRELKSKLGCQSILRRIRKFIRGSSLDRVNTNPNNKSNFDSHTVELEMGSSQRNRVNLQLSRSMSPKLSRIRTRSEEAEEQEQPLHLLQYRKNKKKKNCPQKNSGTSSGSCSTGTPTTSGSRRSYAFAVNAYDNANASKMRNHQDPISELEAQNEMEKGRESSGPKLDSETLRESQSCSAERIVVLGERRRNLETLII